MWQAGGPPIDTPVYVCVCVCVWEGGGGGGRSGARELMCGKGSILQQTL